MGFSWFSEYLRTKVHLFMETAKLFAKKMDGDPHGCRPLNQLICINEKRCPYQMKSYEVNYVTWLEATAGTAETTAGATEAAATAEAATATSTVTTLLLSALRLEHLEQLLGGKYL